MINKQIIKNLEEWVNVNVSDADHLIQTGYWVKRAFDNVTDELFVACITHDVERYMRSEEDKEFFERNFPNYGKAKEWADREFLLWHGVRSAEIVSEKLRSLGVNEESIKEIGQLIIVHELGGNEDENKIKDADSLSFFEIQTPKFIKKVINGELTKNSVKVKFEWMYERMSSEKAKGLAKAMYEKAVNELEES